MEFVGANRILDDCMIVAIHNAIIAAGKPSTYEKVRNVSIRRGWYRKGKGFQCKFLDEAFERFGVKIKSVPQTTTTKQYFDSVVNNKKAYFMFCPCPYGGKIGHAMVATRGERGVKVINPMWYDTGWKTLSRDIRSGRLKIYSLEIERST